MFINFSLLFFFLLLGIIGLYLFSEHQKRYYVLLILSLIFYLSIAKLAFFVLIAFSVLVFISGKHIEKLPGKIHYFAIIFLCLTPLLIDKIYFTSKLQINDYFKLIGISYISFNGLSYLFDIKKGYLKPETNFCLFLLYLIYLPYIFIGPLHRYREVARQFKENISLNNLNFSNGFRLVLWGCFKHWVLAQRLNIIVETIFNDRVTYQGVYVYIGGFAFFLYLYCDFSSYVDIFQGVSQTFGIKLKSNFRNQVYASHSRKHFWAGWHVTLNHWFRDYFFYPLSRYFRTKWQNNILMILTFVLIGVWHELSIKFLIWGMLNACWILTENQVRPYFSSVPNNLKGPLGIVYHITIASFLAVIFRTNDLAGSMKSLFSFSHWQIPYDWVVMKQFIYILPLFVLMDLVNRKAGEKRIDEYVSSLNVSTRWCFYVSLILLIVIMGIPTSNDAYYVRF
ncbi:MBOAT family O-acyltransferase [Dyadobacter diqingensis]|uniref:MBOAT family O-acyltransferase n=1 Tax=Dyadobacter diqingensis TaxID=2938121 RepID=UPI0020C3360D|nr:MBOAT family O-acyltransferase [Dyadobacter diqingensis]